MSHSIVWTFENDSVEGKAVCDDDECLNRYRCGPDCEVYYDVRRDPDGNVTHAPWDDENRQAIQRHVMEKDTTCSVCEFLNADPWILKELNDGHQSFEIASTPIVPVWDGDGCLWRVPEPSDAGGDRG